MLIRFQNEATSWIHGNEAVVALVGNSATRQFSNISLFANELEKAYSFVCFDTPSKEDFNWLIYEQEIDNKFEFVIKEEM